MRILYLSDLHHLNNYPYQTEGYGRVFNDFPNVLETLTQVIESNHFDLLILGGDLTEHGSKEDYVAIKNCLEGYPYLLTLGNHDHKEAFYEAFYGEKKSEKYHRVHLQDDYCFILFDSSQEGLSEGLISENDLKWLEKQIHRYASNYQIVFLTHHHLLSFQHDTLPLNAADKVLSLLQNDAVKLILTAHTHTPFYFLSKKTHYISTGSLAYRAHRKGSRLIFNNERYYSMLQIDDESFSFEFKQVHETVLDFTSFDLEKETL